MKAKTIKLLTATSVFALGVAAVAGLAGTGVLNTLLSKADATRYVEIKASDIAAAIGEGSAGNFTVAGLEWHVDNASYEGGTATINGGVLYNTTFAGQTVNPLNNMKGNGFQSMEIVNKASASGINFETRDSSGALIKRRDLGAESQASYTVNFSDDNTDSRKVAQVFCGFGAGGGTSFTAIKFYYTCAEAVPTLTLTPNKTSASVGDTITLAKSYENVGGTTPTATFYSNDTDVCTVDSNGVVTGVAAGTTTVYATFSYDAKIYTSNSVELTFVSSIENRSITFKSTCNLEGSGVNLYIENIDAGHDNLQILSSGDTDKVSVHVLFDGGTNFKGYEATNSNIDRTPFYINMEDANATAFFYFTLPNGFPNNDDFIHTFEVTINYSASIVYSGTIRIQGNKTIL